MKKLITFLVVLSLVNCASRVFTLKNLCNEPVWFGFSGGSTQNKQHSGVICQSDGDCYSGSSCVRTGDISQCFFNNPQPSDNNYRLEQGQSKSVEIPILDNGSDVIWSGIVTGRTKCTAASCEKADCGGGDKGCKKATGFSQPATQGEITMLKSSPDNYDVEVINGIHMPVSMGPTNAPGSGSYNCGTPGAKYPRTNVGGCDWNLQPPAVEYRWVTAGGNGCSSDSQCGGGSVCGLSFNPGHADLFQKTCGSHLGFWSADQVCGVTRNFGAPFDCNKQFKDGLTNWHLYACVGVGSCYQPGAGADCCGCANWEEEGVNVPPYPSTETCKNKNSYWHQNIKQSVLWMKKACPTSYTYPYDDPSSLFTCFNKQGGVNMVNYEVTFCPQNA